jgi:hypothetical protein
MTESTAFADPAEGFGDELRPGTKLLSGQYTIERFLNAGGFGITYLARDSLGRRVVIKECFPSALCSRSERTVRARSRAYQNDLSSVVRQFVQEAHHLAKMTHPNIVGVHQVFEDNDTAYMVLDHIDGSDLLDLMNDPALALSPSEVRSILITLLDAVGFVHDTGILHRDISPDNILLDAQKNPILIDFGAAREDMQREGRALSAIRVVKEGYSPQELYVTGSQQSPSSDLYALAASFYHLIAGAPPPDSQGRLAAAAEGSHDPYVPLTGRYDAYGPEFLSAIDKCLSVLPKNRLQSSKEWLAAITGPEGAAAVTAPDEAEGKVLRLPIPEPARPAEAAQARSAPATKVLAPKTEGKLPLVVGLCAGVTVAAVAAFLLLQDKGSTQPSTSLAAVGTEETAAVTEPAAAVEQPAKVVVADPKPEGAAVPDVAAEPAIKEIAPVMSNWAFDLPFTVANDDPAAVGDILGVVPAWVKPGLRIVAVNGVAVGSIGEMEAGVSEAVDPEERASLQVTLTTRDANSGEPARHTLELPVIQETLLLNGIGFRGRMVQGRWQETVVALPKTYEGELRSGDVLVAHVGSGAAIDGKAALATILEKDVKAGLKQDVFAVLRDGTMWVVTIQLPQG